MVCVPKSIIENKRLAHSKSVAELMYSFIDNPREDVKESLYTLGLLHDIGYMYGEPIGHSIRGGLLLKSMDFKYWQEVYYHGQIETDGFESTFLDILNWADLNVDSSGEVVGYSRRIYDILVRYGADSINYISAIYLRSSLESKGFKSAI